MEKMITLLVAAIFFSLVTTGLAADKEKGSGKLRHVVALKFKESTTPEQIKLVEKNFKGLKKKIREIKGFEWGLNNSPEKHNKGFTHGFILTFKSEKDRDTYLNHPDHKVFADFVVPLIADVFVIDYWAQD